MISKISIKNFKSIYESEIFCKNLNLYTGPNSAGKSTILQSLLLLRQSYDAGYFTRPKQSIFLGNADSLIRIGNYKDIFSQNASKDSSLQIKIEFEQNSSIEFICSPYSVENRDRILVDGNLHVRNITFAGIRLFSDRFQYLAAERISPQEDYPRFVDNEFLGKDGRFSLNYLEKHGNSPVLIDALRHGDVSLNRNSLHNHVAAWLGEISSNIDIQVQENLGTNRIELSYLYRSGIDNIPSQNVKPQNIGFGITHTLPIIIAILASRPGDIFLIENPEAHLHPRGQSKLAELISLAAQNGVQFFVETHSDHIINGTLVACKKYEENKAGIDKNLVKLFFVHQNDNSFGASIIPIEILEGGKIDQQPNGFFDQQEKDLQVILGF